MRMSHAHAQVMSCPGGCVGGGGQPKSRDPQALAKRAATIYSIDEASTVRKSHENPSIQRIYAVGPWIVSGWSLNGAGPCQALASLCAPTPW
jgi:hypothetical protein